ncbi:MAG: flagellar biosynthetic protein FliO [Dermatophilus congolensis]|nr:flagellar biosynthetic protein FliO [Dermatophilus congolensis]
MTEGVLLALRTVVSLAVVLALLVFFIRWLDKNSNRAKRDRTNAQAPVDVLSRTALSRTSSIQVVRVGGQVLVLGVTDASVNVLTDLGPADFEHPRSAAIAEQVEAQGVATDGIVATLMRRQGKHRGAEPLPASAQTVEPMDRVEHMQPDEPVERFLVGFDIKESRD